MDKSYIVLYNPSEDVIANTEPSKRDDIITKEAIKMILSPTMLIQPIVGGAYLVRMEPTNYLCLVTKLSRVESLGGEMEAVRAAAEKLLYWMPSSETAWLKITVDDNLLLKSLD